MNSNISDRWPKINGHYVPGRKYSAIKYNAARRGIHFDVSIDYLDQQWEFQNGRCFYTGVELDLASRDGATASLDRKDSSIGYIEGNVRWVEKDINYCKYTLSEDRFLDLIVQIYEHAIRGKEINIL
jgi:hypothetical protein